MSGDTKDFLLFVQNHRESGYFAERQIFGGGKCYWSWRPLELQNAGGATTILFQHTHTHTRVNHTEVRIRATTVFLVFVCSCLQIFTVDASFKVELEFTLSVTQVEQTMDAIRRCLWCEQKSLQAKCFSHNFVLFSHVLFSLYSQSTYICHRHGRRGRFDKAENIRSEASFS